MRRLLTLTLLTLAACGGSSDTTRPPDNEPAPLSLSIVTGDGQSAQVAHELPAPISIVVTRAETGTLRLTRDDGLSLSRLGAHAQMTAGGAPVPGQVVTFHVVEPGCGQPFSAAGQTDSLGRVQVRWILGTRAQTCHMETLAVDPENVDAIAVDTATAVAMPGAVDTLTLNVPAYVFPGATFNARDLVLRAADQYGNVIVSRHRYADDPPEVDGDLPVTVSAPAGWTVDGEEVTAPTAVGVTGTLTITAGNGAAPSTSRPSRRFRPPGT